MANPLLFGSRGWDDQFRPIPPPLHPFGGDGQPFLPIATQDFDGGNRRLALCDNAGTEQMATETLGHFSLRIQSAQMHDLHQQRLEVLEATFWNAVHQPSRAEEVELVGASRLFDSADPHGLAAEYTGGADATLLVRHLPQWVMDTRHRGAGQILLSFAHITIIGMNFTKSTSRYIFVGLCKTHGLDPTSEM